MTQATKNKIVYGVIAAALIGIFLLGRGCGIRSVLKTEGSDTTIHHDTTIIKYQPVPYTVHDSKVYYVNGKPVPYAVHDTTEIPVIIEGEIDTAALIRRFLDTAFYSTTKTQGKISATAIDTVTQNRIVGASLVITSQDTTIKTTTVLTKPKNFVLSFKVGAMGNIKEPFYSQGAGLELKLPNDATYSASIFKVWGEKQPYIMVTKGWVLFGGKK